MARTAAERGREVRQQLVGAARELIAERGWSAVSTRMLAERAGVAPGLVHYHFASLPALLTEAAIGAMRSAVEEIGQLLDQAGTPAQMLDRMLTALEVHTGRDPLSLLFTETYLAATRDDDLRAAVSGIVVDLRDRLARWLGGHGISEPERTAAVLAAAIDGVVLHRALQPDLTARTVAPILRGILRTEGERG
ncbi:MAG TPA: TetR/AcrR family transcriptional regulator [Actinophytocola sp.]|nr:TetR/AcrR family transcriptional regulator [Actinophytocola sp.]HET9142457.1 TetR/AcrR family transcriptional regulator [Actinophytocola sp.]